jgi:hypothetical protein
MRASRVRGCTIEIRSEALTVTATLFGLSAAPNLGGDRECE